MSIRAEIAARMLRERKSAMSPCVGSCPCDFWLSRWGEFLESDPDVSAAELQRIERDCFNLLSCMARNGDWQLRFFAQLQLENDWWVRQDAALYRAVRQ